MTVTEYAITYLKNEVRIIETSHRREVLAELSTFKKAIIYKYTEDGFDDLNEHLRVGKGDNIPLFGILLAECLAKLPDFDEIAYRGINLTSIELQRYIDAFENNTVITEPYFISSSSSIYVGNSYGENLFKIFSKSGKKLMQFLSILKKRKSYFVSTADSGFLQSKIIILV